MSMLYTKPPFPIEKQLERLQSRGLIGDSNTIKNILNAVGYYRLTGYLHQFKRPSSDLFYEGLTIDDIWHLYTFDRALRAITMEAIGRIEVWLRAQLAIVATNVSQDAFHYVSLWKTNGKDPFKENCIKDLDHASQVLHIKHFKEAYQNPYPPTWMAIEVFSFGTTCHYLERCERPIAGKIAEAIGIDRALLLNWLQILRATRNICAHHQRLWDVNINSQPNLSRLLKFPNLSVTNPILDLYTTTPELILEVKNQRIWRTPIYLPLALCAQMLNTFRPESQWKQRLLSLLSTYETFINKRLQEVSGESIKFFGFSNQQYLTYPLWQL